MQICQSSNVMSKSALISENQYDCVLPPVNTCTRFQVMDLVTDPDIEKAYRRTIRMHLNRLYHCHRLCNYWFPLFIDTLEKCAQVYHSCLETRDLIMITCELLSEHDTYQCHIYNSNELDFDAMLCEKLQMYRILEEDLPNLTVDELAQSKECFTALTTRVIKMEDFCEHQYKQYTRYTYLVTSFESELEKLQKELEKLDDELMHGQKIIENNTVFDINSY